MTTKIDEIAEDVQQLKERLLERKPERFSKMDIARSFFGALFIGVTFVFSGRLIDIIKVMELSRIAFLVSATIAILIAEIYFVGWTKIKSLKEPGRNFFEFTLKRLFVFYAVSLIVAAFYFYILGYNSILSGAEALEFIFLVAMPCSIGAAVSDLLRKY